MLFAPCRSLQLISEKIQIVGKRGWKVNFSLIARAVLFGVAAFLCSKLVCGCSIWLIANANSCLIIKRRGNTYACSALCDERVLMAWKRNASLIYRIDENKTKLDQADAKFVKKRRPAAANVN